MKDLIAAAPANEARIAGNSGGHGGSGSSSTEQSTGTKGKARETLAAIVSRKGGAKDDAPLFIENPVTSRDGVARIMIERREALGTSRQEGVL